MVCVRAQRRAFITIIINYGLSGKKKRCTPAKKLGMGLGPAFRDEVICVIARIAHTKVGGARGLADSSKLLSSTGSGAPYGSRVRMAVYNTRQLGWNDVQLRDQVNNQKETTLVMIY